MAQAGPPAGRAGSTEGKHVLQVLHHCCTSVLVFKWLHMLHVSSPEVNDHRAFLHPCRTWSFMSLPAPLLFRIFISLGQALARKGVR